MNDRLRLICDYMHYSCLPRLDRAQDKAAWYGNLLVDPDVPTFGTADTGAARVMAARILGEQVAARGIDRIRMGVTAGLDSRGLLGIALDVLGPDRIVAFTSGQPGNRDRELARYYTEAVLSEHSIVETQSGTYDTDAIVRAFSNRPPGFVGTLIGISKRTSTPVKNVGKLPSIAGYLGDAISGKRLHGRIHTDWQEACAAFVRKNDIYRPASKRVLASLLPAAYDPYHILPAKPFLPAELMGYDDQVDLCYRQHQRIRLSFKPYSPEEIGGHQPAAKLNLGKITIYDDPRIQKSYLQMPQEERLNQRFYKRMMLEQWPQIFRDLVSPDDPRWAPEPPPATQQEKLARSARSAGHTNWEMLWAENPNFNTFARTLMLSLAGRRLLHWLDPAGIVEELDRDPLGLGKIIVCLCSVELNIRAGRLPDAV